MGHSFWRMASAVMLIGSGAAAIAVLAAEAPVILVRLDARRAVAAPLLVAVLTAVIGICLLARDAGPGSWFLAQAVFAIQIPAFSAGLVTYRLVIGPFLTITLAGQTLGFGLHGGVDAHFLFITGGASHLPFGIAVDLVALAGLTAACMGFVETISVNEAVERTTV